MISVILCAAGNGTRAKFPENKVLHELNGLPVLSYSLSVFSPLADEILVTVRREDEAGISALLSPFPTARTVHGGDTRTASVLNALKEAQGDIVLIHDAARPFVTAQMIKDCIESVEKFGSGVCALPATDTTAIAEQNCILRTLARDTVYTVQTPQGFRRDELLSAYEAAFADGREREFTDDSGIYAAYKGCPRLYCGDRANRKLTYPEDFAPAVRVGFGVDTHAFDIPADYALGIMRLNLNYIVLGGVTIASRFSLKAHSDGDVLVHALMDALLSAANLRDIGYYFPDTDPAYQGISSMKLLEKVMGLVRAEGLAVQNASISVLAEAPRLSDHIEKMRENLRAALDCENVAIAAGTNEKLGYVGEGKGITVYATVLLSQNK